jgi:hypothetical protein
MSIYAVTARAGLRALLVSTAALSASQVWPGRGSEEVSSSSQELKTAPSPARSAAVDSCKQGYVWREARKGDHVCVTPARRDAVARQNQSARERWVQGAYGPQTCIPGYVWREAYPGDKVCVTPDFRTKTAEDNRLSAQRRAGG